MPHHIQPRFVLALHASVQSFFNFKRSRGLDTSVRGAPRSRAQHVWILSNSCILNRWIPALPLVVNSYINGKGFNAELRAKVRALLHSHYSQKNSTLKPTKKANPDRLNREWKLASQNHAAKMFSVIALPTKFFQTYSLEIRCEDTGLILKHSACLTWIYQHESTAETWTADLPMTLSTKHFKLLETDVQITSFEVNE